MSTSAARRTSTGSLGRARSLTSGSAAGSCFRTTSANVSWPPMGRRRVRRPWGGGTIEARANGTFRVAMSIKGTRLRETYATREEAEVALAKLQLRRAMGSAPPSELTIAACLTRWLDEAPPVRPSTYKQREMIARVHLIPAIGQIRLRDLTPQHVDDYLRSVQRAPQTKSHHRAILRTAIRWAEKRGWIDRNAAALSEPPRVPRTERRYLSADEARRLIAETRDDRLGPLWAVAVTTGLRLAECLGLAWEDVDLADSTLTVRKQLARVKANGRSEWRRVETKTPRSRRTIPLTEIARDALARHQKRMTVERKPEWEYWGLVFVTELGQPIHGPNVLPRLYEALDRTKLPRVTFHQLRHSAAAIMLQAGVPLRVVQEILGHSTIPVLSAPRIAPAAEGTKR
jgi:integrase